MSKDDLNDLVIHTSDILESWRPEDYGFTIPKHLEGKGVWYYKNYELRSLANEYWLCRRKITNKNNNTEMVVKWYLKIPIFDKQWADEIFSKGLK